MRRIRLFPSRSFRISTVLLWIAILALCGRQNAHGELHWQRQKKEPIKIRLVALAWNHQRSSYFASEEVFIAEKQLDQDESRLVKLIYGFLPYQPRLSESGFTYSTVYELRATRDPSCDQSLAQITSGEQGDWRQASSDLKYSEDAPALNLQRGKSALPCYRSTPEDYNRSEQEPARESPPVLSVR